MKSILILAFAAIAAFASGVEIGQKFPQLSFENQHEEQLLIDNDTKKVIIAFSKESGAIVKDFLDQNDGYLQQNSAIYLVDVSRVPSLVMSMFMMPSFRKYDFEMGLIKDKIFADSLPRQGSNLTIIELDNLEVTSIDFSKNL